MSEPTPTTVRRDAALAGLVVAPSWPLSSTIAVNPLSGMEDQRLPLALDRAELLFGGRGLLTLGEYRAALHAGRVTVEGLRAALGRAVALDGLPPVRVGDRWHPVEDVLLADLIDGVEDPAPARALRSVAEQVDAAAGTDLAAQVDLVASEHCLQAALGVRRLPAALRDADPAEVLLEALHALRVPAYAHRSYLEVHVAALPGWSAHLRWRDESGDGGSALLEYLAVRLEAEARLVDGRGWYHGDGPLPRTATATVAARTAAVARALGATADEHQGLATALAVLPARRRALVWLDAYEHGIHDRILTGIERARAPRPSITSDV
ncbi:MAG TPA: putative inorganic carbon transporter subunit DabA, partial [Aquihabitans sp.]|nr:putative inorganic carbon transporter subunit DabA [Aquihabitans sp.]